MHPLLSKARFERDIAGINAELCAERKWTLFSAAFPILDIGFSSSGMAKIRVRLQCENWNDVPPAIELLAFDGTPLESLPSGLADIFNNSQHPITKRPFICMRGSREYHMHDSHRTEPWDDLKGKPGYRLGEIVTQVWNGWKRANP
jgi:hypothetical protein